MTTTATTTTTATPASGHHHYANLHELRIVSSDSFASQSPTDSGYRSAPRHIDGVTTTAAQPTVVHVNGSPPLCSKNNKNNYHSSLETTTSSSSGDGNKLPTTADNFRSKLRAESVYTINNNSSTNVSSLPDDYSLDRCPKLVELERWVLTVKSY